MTNLLTVLPDFDVRPYTHILPSLERALVSTADLLTLGALDVAKRAQVPPGEVKKLADALLHALHSELAGANVLPRDSAASTRNGEQPQEASLYRAERISTLDDHLDRALGGGILPGYLTEVVGESAVGKTQFMLTLLLSVQLHQGKGALYISTEAPLQTTRLTQILATHPKLSSLAEEDQPSLSRIQSTHIHDVEAQEHILRYQVPVAIRKQNIGLLVIDSIAANYRAEFDKTKARKGAASFIQRNNQLAQLGALLRDIARTHNVAVVVANQVADRFTTAETSSTSVRGTQSTQVSTRQSPPRSRGRDTAQYSSALPADPSEQLTILSTDDPLSLDHQMRFFTGWGDDPVAENLKTPSLGLTWTNQLAARIALLKEPIYEDRAYQLGEDRNVAGWKRTAKVVFSAWCAESNTGFEIYEGGIRGLQALDFA